MKFNYSTKNTEKAAKALKLNAEDKQALFEAVGEDFKENMNEVIRLKNEESKQQSKQETKQETKQEQQQSIKEMAREARIIK